MQHPIRILSTKKLLVNQKQFLLNAGFTIIEADFIQTTNIDFQSEEINNNLIFTSQNAVISLLENPEAEQLKSKPAFCVGLKTKSLLEYNGFHVIAHTGYAADLAEIITLIYNKETFTFFSGNLRREALPKALQAAGIHFNEIKVYETKLMPQKINSKADGILFFSPSAVESYLKNNSITNEICFCIGATTASALEDKKIQNIIIAHQPTIENTIIQCINEYK